MAILKALEFIQNSKAGKKTVLIYTDSRITLQLLQNQKKHTNLIEQIRTKFMETETRLGSGIQLDQGTCGEPWE